MKAILTLLFGFTVFACTSPSGSQGTQPQSESDRSDAASADADTAEVKAPATTRVEESQLSDSEKQMLTQARQAQKELATRLMGTLKSAVAEGNFERGVEVCKTAAPSLTQSVEDDLEVEIGRTSFKLRNPENAPRPWAEPWVEKRTEENVILRTDAGALHTLSPIRLAEPCVQCHGTAEQIPDEVQAMLAEKYPDDEAIGFAPNDLRGYFWVEVSGG